MRLSGLSLETAYFEDYLSFLTEVLELELCELTEISMKLDLKETWLEIKKVPCVSHHINGHIEFILEREDFEALMKKVSFFYYRREDSKFLFLSSDHQCCDLTDPDGRVWRFRKDFSSIISHGPQSIENLHVRNY
jgi:hypothetical protein